MKHANVAIFVPHIGCPNQCSFCNQRSISGQQQAPTPNDVEQACRQALEQLGEKSAYSELAFFGGSFTAIERGYMCSLLEAAMPYVGEGKLYGVRLSTRPDAISEEILDLLQQYQVSAIELGVQSMDDAVLESNRRGHTAQDVRRACGLIHARGIELGLQMMTGLYLDTPETDLETAHKIAELRPETVRIYPTILIQGTPLATLYRQGLYHPAGLEPAVELGSQLLEFFWEQRIHVIRLGLHASVSLEHDILAGPYHPAFRELCEGKIYLKRALELLKHYPSHQAINLFVAPRSISKMIGQKKQNVQQLAALGYPVTIKPLEGLEEFQIKVSLDKLAVSKNTKAP